MLLFIIERQGNLSFSSKSTEWYIRGCQVSNGSFCPPASLASFIVILYPIRDLTENVTLFFSTFTQYETQAFEFDAIPDICNIQTATTARTRHERLFELVTVCITNNK
jgi:hypothetical protein